MKDLPADLWVVVPAYNEGRVIKDFIEKLLQVWPRVIVVDDGSTDQTPQILSSLPICWIRHDLNLGQGAALQTGIEWALNQNASVIVTFDADGQMDPSNIEALVKPIIEGQVDVVLGTRFLSGANSGVPRLRKVLLKLALFFTKRSTGLKISDAHNGFRAFRSSALKKIHLRQPRMAHASEILHQIAYHHLSYAEVPVEIQYTEYSQSKGQKNWDALNILWELFFH